MLVIEVASIPPEGLEVKEALSPGEIHIEGEDTFVRSAGGYAANIEAFTTVAPPAMKWPGESTWVPKCSGTRNAPAA